MEQQQLNNHIVEEEEQNISLKEILGICLSNWYWFVFSVLVCLAAGTLYILRTEPSYTRTADVLMRDDMRNTSVGGDLANTFSSLGIPTSRSDVYNEIFVIKSPIIFEQVIRNLNLTTSYAHEGMLRNTTLYGSNLPVEVKFSDADDETSCSLRLSVDKSGKGELDEFVKWQGGEMIESNDKVAFNPAVIDTVSTPLGKIITCPNPRYTGVVGDQTEYRVSHAPIESAIDGLAQGIVAEMPEEHASIIHLTYDDTSIERANDILNNLIKVYNEKWVEDRNEVARATSAFINDRLTVIESELGTVEQDISSFKSANLLPDVDAVSSLYLKKADDTSNEILELTNKLQMAEYVRQYLSNPAYEKNVIPANSGIGSAAIERQIELYNQNILDRTRYLSNSSASNPIVRDLDKQIDDTRAAIMTSVDNQIVSLNNTIANLRRSERASTAKLAANPEQSKKLISIERQQKVKEALYMFLLQKREENEIGQTFAPYNTRVISYSRGALIPTAPKKINILIVSFLAGLLIPFGLIFVYESLNTTVRGRRDLENMKTPLLGEIPLNGKFRKRWRLYHDKFKKDQNVKPSQIIVGEGKNDIVNEAFRIVRSAVSNYNRRKEGEARVIMITSAVAASGKTFISMNLAAAFAIKKRRTLIIDADLRRHSLTSSLAKGAKMGLSTILAGGANFDSAVINNVDGIENLSLLPSGPVPPNPAELLESPAMKELLESLRSKYDDIIIDCPPSLMVTDANAISSVVDQTIYVVRVGNLERSMLAQIDKLYLDHKFNNLAVVLNGTRRNSGYHNGYGYSYGYGYYYSKSE